MKFNPDNLNIHELAVEEPEKESEVFFDPERDISDKERRGFFDTVAVDFGHSRLIEAGEHSAQAKVIGIEINLTKEEWNNLLSDTKYFFKSDNDKRVGDGGISRISQLKILGNYEIDHPRPEEMQNKLRGFAEQKNYLWALSLAARMKEAGLNPVIDDEDREEIVKELNAEYFDSKVGIRERARLLADAKVLGLPIMITQEDWDKFNKVIDKLKEESNFKDLLSQYSYLTILSADEVRIPEGGGLELIRHKKESLQIETPQVPEQKQF